MENIVIVDEELQAYFDACVNYWKGFNDSVRVAIAHAIWYDCIEVWDMDDSWTDAKLEFVRQYIPDYRKGEPVPEPDDRDFTARIVLHEGGNA